MGRLYRLSGGIRTQEAPADPVARYPTAVPAALSMASFPFTNTSMPVGGTREWTRSEAVLICIVANSVLQLYRMTKVHRQPPVWAVFKGEEVLERGYLPPRAFVVELEEGKKRREI